MATNILSRNVISQIFGPEFTASLQPVGHSKDGSSSGENKDHVALISNLIGVAHSNHDDGAKPSKSPRTTSSADTKIEEAKQMDRNVISSDSVGLQIQEHLDAVLEERRKLQKSVKQEGKLGPDVVVFDVGSHVGSFVISNDRLGVNSQCNFGSVKASACVYKGKWQYEVQLGSKGVMQLGWATLETKFSQERGVGDTSDSYAYDGNRLRKWNKTTTPYGETWQAGDVIGCCIDMNEGKMEFFRNGKSMGVAFNNIRQGPGIAYFPAASLAYGENIVVNFGATPFQYLVEGYSPLQLQSSLDNTKTDALLRWTKNVLSLYPGGKFFPEYGRIPNQDYQTLLVITNRLLEFLGPYLHSGFVVEQSFFPFFASCLGLPEKITHNHVISTKDVSYNKTDLLLDIMWTFLEESEMKMCLERLCIILMSQFRSNSLSLAYPYQHYSLHCLIALARHRTTRRHLIRYLLFDKTKLMHFLHIRPMDETVLKEVIPETWWPGKSPENSPDALSYQRKCQTIHARIKDVENLQIILLKTLLTNTDGTEKRPSSRSLFLRKFRHFVRDVVRPGSVLQQPVNKAMATFFCFSRTIAELYSEEVQENSEKLFPYIPPSMFYDTSVSYFEMERVGGLSNYLYKAHHKEVSEALSIPDYINAATSSGAPSPPPAHHVHQATPYPTVINLSSDPGSGNEDSDDDEDGSQTITVTLPRPHPLGVTGAPTERQVGILATGAAIANSPTVHPFQMRNNPIPVAPASTPVQPPAERDENTGRNVSATSSGEDLTPSNPMPHFGAAILAGTPSGHNMLIPMLADLRNFVAQGEHGVAYFPGGFLGYPGGMDVRHPVLPHNPAVALLGKDSGIMEVRASLRELLDNAIIIYSSGVHRHMEKVVSLRSTMDEYVKALEGTKASLNKPSISANERAELLKSIDIFTEKLAEQARHIAWVKSAVFTKERQEAVFQLLKNMLATLQSASAQGPLFTFVPDHYISTLINLTWDLLTHIHPTVPYTSLPNLEVVLAEVAEFVATHFTDPRIVIAETKDTLTQALSSFICNRTMLTALEDMPRTSQVTMVKAILRPYENRAWAQSNWMLVRFWQGAGFGFQFPNALEARRSFRAKPVQDEFGISTNLPPTPSPILQNLVAGILLEDQKLAVSFVHSVLNQLNWAFSEFVGLLQEIQNAAQRPERVFIESRQLKICCTCFELTQALLRVMEMIANLASPVMLDSARESAEPLLARLFMLLSQILNRIGSNTGSFAQVLDLGIPGLENITHYPLLSSVAGILVALVIEEVDKPQDAETAATQALLTEPSFQIDSLNFFLGREQTAPEGRAVFSLQNHVPDDVSADEIRRLEKVITHLKTSSQKLRTEIESLDDDEVCTICYAYQKNTFFKPCNHRSCKACILHHLMNRGECFFCKATIQQVFTDDGTKIYDNSTKKTEEPARHSPSP